MRISKAPSVAQSIDLFAKHHILHVRRKKNGEIVAVKHAAAGWISPQTYYYMEKMHDLMPLLLEFVHGGYRMKQALWGISVDVLGVTIPVGSALPIIETANLYFELTRTKEITEIIHHEVGELINPPGPGHRPGPERLTHAYDETVTKTVPDIHPDMLLFRAYALLGPFGDVLQIMDTLGQAGSLSTVPAGQQVPDSLNLGLGGLVGFLTSGKWRWW